MVLAVVLMVIGSGRRRSRGSRDHEIEVTGGIVQRGVTGRIGSSRGRTGRAAMGWRGRQGLLLVVVIPVVRRVLLLYDMLLL